MTPANEMELKFDSRSANEGFARVAVAAFMTQLYQIEYKHTDNIEYIE